MITCMKVCTKCKREKPLSEFYIKRRKDCKNGYSAYCKLCQNSSSAKYYNKNKQAASARRRKQTLKKYGITEAKYQQMLNKQGGTCLFCSNTEASPGKRLMIDHCHVTGKVRALLCFACNSRIGWFENNRERLEKYCEREL